MSTKWLDILERYETQSLSEVKGPKSNPVILHWLQIEGRGKSWVKDDSTPWCGAAMAGVMTEAGFPEAIPAEPLRAVSWLNLPAKLDGPREGAIVVFKRSGGHHVTVVKKFDNETLWCVGGNQSDKVCTSKFKRSGALGYRWPVPLVDAKELAKTSRIAASAQQQKIDQAKAQGMLGTSPAPEIVPPPPPSWRESIDGTLGDVSWAKGLLSYGADFGGFVGSHWTFIAIGIAGFFILRSYWHAGVISDARVSDANLGWTT